ncbi:hypothetical protein Ancab_025924 [Ancistrocladus abbreviatus]
MEKKLSKASYDKECMREAILKHEEIFREQVCELHRLYRIQKVLMSSVEKNPSHRQKRERWISNRTDNHCHQQKAEVYIAESNANEIEESEIELTLGPSMYNNRRSKTVKLSYSGQSLSSSSTGSSQVSKTSPREYQMTEVGFLKASETEVGLNENAQESNLGTDRLRQDGLKQPPWLFQALSLRLA